MTFDRPGSRLTARQSEVLSLLARGFTQREAGAQLGLTRETIRTHVQRARRALGARTVVHAVALALEEEALEADSTARPRRSSATRSEGPAGQNT